MSGGSRWGGEMGARAREEAAVVASCDGVCATCSDQRRSGRRVCALAPAQSAQVRHRNHKQSRRAEGQVKPAGRGEIKARVRGAIPGAWVLLAVEVDRWWETASVQANF